MPENSKRDPFGLLKQILFILAIILIFMASVAPPAGAFVYFKTNETPGIDTTKVVRSGNASDQCIQQGLLKNPERDGGQAWTNLRGGPGTGKDVLPYFRDAASRYKVPLGLALAVGEQESTFTHNLSNDGHDGGVTGLMQIKVSTFNGARAAAGFPKGDVKNLKDNVYVGVSYLAEQYNRFHKNPSLAAAAYNAGYGTVINAGSKVPNIPETRKYVNNVMAVYNEIAKCSTPANRNSSTNGQKIAAEALTRIGDLGTKYNGDGSNACAAFVVDVIKTVTGSTQNLLFVVPDNWAGAAVLTNGNLGKSMSIKGSRFVIDDKFALGGAGDQKITLADIQPGDYIFFADPGTKLGYNNPHHSGIYVGDVTDPTTKQVVKNGVVTLSSSLNNNQGGIILKSLDTVMSSFDLIVIGVRRF